MVRVLIFPGSFPNFPNYLTLQIFPQLKSMQIWMILRSIQKQSKQLDHVDRVDYVDRQWPGLRSTRTSVPATCTNERQTCSNKGRPNYAFRWQHKPQSPPSSIQDDLGDRQIPSANRTNDWPCPRPTLVAGAENSAIEIANSNTLAIGWRTAGSPAASRHTTPLISIGEKSEGLSNWGNLGKIGGKLERAPCISMRENFNAFQEGKSSGKS